MMKKRRNKRKSEEKHSNDKNIPYNKKSIFLIPLRYLILLGIILLKSVIYIIITPLTLYPADLLLSLFTKVTLITSNVPYPLLILGDITPRLVVEIVPACIAGSAYILLLILNLSIPMNLRKRIYSITLSVIILLLFNILRITLFSMLYYYNLPFVDFTHMLFWYVISTIFVVGLWFLMVKTFKIKEIPVYSDIKHIYHRIKYDK